MYVVENVPSRCLSMALCFAQNDTRYILSTVRTRMNWGNVECDLSGNHVYFWHVQCLTVQRLDCWQILNCACVTSLAYIFVSSRRKSSDTCMDVKWKNSILSNIYLNAPGRTWENGQNQSCAHCDGTSQPVQPVNVQKNSTQQRQAKTQLLQKKQQTPKGWVMQYN